MSHQGLVAVYIQLKGHLFQVNRSGGIGQFGEYMVLSQRQQRFFFAQQLHKVVVHHVLGSSRQFHVQAMLAYCLLQAFEGIIDSVRGIAVHIANDVGSADKPVQAGGVQLFQQLYRRRNIR